MHGCIAGGVDYSSEAEALHVPDALLSTVSNKADPDTRLFTEDPVALRAQWRRVVESILSLDAKLKQLGHAARGGLN